jgi:hypothetical protein
VARPNCRERDARLKFHSIKTAREAKHATNTPHGSIGGTCRGKNIGGVDARAVVAKVTVAVATFDPFSVADGGETVHVDAAGAPVQLQVTGPLKLFTGVAVTVKFAGLPAAMVSLDGAAETL